MTRALRLAALLALCAAPAFAQTQPIPGAINSNGTPADVQGSAIVVAPAGGGAGRGKVVATDAPLPTASYVGGAAPGFLSYRLATNASITSGACSTPVTAIAGGSYVVALTASAWNSSTVALQYLGPDNSTWYASTGATWTSGGAVTVGVVLGANSSVRLCATGGTPTGVNSTAS